MSALRHEPANRVGRTLDHGHAGLGASFARGKQTGTYLLRLGFRFGRPEYARLGLAQGGVLCAHAWSGGGCTGVSSDTLSRTGALLPLAAHPDQGYRAAA